MPEGIPRAVFVRDTVATTRRWEGSGISSDGCEGAALVELVA